MAKRFYKESELVFIQKPKNPKFQDLKGSKFGRLNVIGYAGQISSGYWYCKCDCGNITKVNTRNLKTGHTASCGCFKRELTIKRSTIHGYTKRGKISRTYKTWMNMITRCQNLNYPRFMDYGGRGINVCDRWQIFENFLEDMGERPENKTLDRKDNNKGYYKENCRWATSKEQANNKRSSILITYNGETKNVSQWEQELGFKKGAIASRIRASWPIEKALTTPTKTKNNSLLQLSEQ